MKIETEQKYYCMDPNNLIDMACNLNFKKINEVKEIDEYFTDINSSFIKNRTCLRIRKTNDSSMEVTFKGKSDMLLGQFSKLENNINVDINDYNNTVKLFESLGYYSYVEVIKERVVYTLDKHDYKYSIMIDKLDDVGGFVEFEIISESDKTKKELQDELNKFLMMFSKLNLKEASRPYRDIVANHYYKKMVSNNEKTNLCIDISNELLKYEKMFFKKYKEEISKMCLHDVKWGEYKKNPSISEKIEDLIKEYMDSIVFDGNELLAIVTLLDKVNFNKYLFASSNKMFLKHFLKLINLNENNIIYISSSDSIKSILKDKGIDLKDSIILNGDLKNICSMILILINE